MPALVTLDLGHNEIETMEGLVGIPGLETLYLTTNKITEIQGLDGLDKLDDISLTQNQISSIEPLVTSKSLTSIGVAMNKLEGTLDVSAFEGLERLDVRENAITDITGLEKLTKLRWLDAGGNAIAVKPDGIDGIETAYLKGNPCESTPTKDTMPASRSGSAINTQVVCTEDKCEGSIGKLTGTYAIDGPGARNVRVTLMVQSGQVKVYLEQPDGGAMSVTASGDAPVAIEGQTTDDEVIVDAVGGTARDVSYRIEAL
jgi:Leucine-rich repeat (LRR) protein